MSNHYVLFSSMIHNLTPEECEWVESYLVCNPELEEPDVTDDWREERCVDPGDEGEWPFFEWEIQVNRGKHDLWLHSSIYCKIPHVCAFVRKFLKRFRQEDTFCGTWAETCDRPLLEAFSGGAFVVTSSGWKATYAYEMVSNLRQALVGGQE